MADERRPGDWQRRDLRKSANDLVEDENPKKWYDQTFWIVFFVVVFWPVGIVLVWRSRWNIVVKIAITAALALVVYVAWSMQQTALQLQMTR